MNLEIALVDALYRVGTRQPEVRETLLEALFQLRRSRWVEPVGRPRRHE